MYLASDYIHPTPRGGRCRIRIYLPGNEHDSPVIISSELPNIDGSSVTYSAHQIAAEVFRYHRLSAPVWTVHYPKEATDGISETFELVVFLKSGCPWQLFAPRLPSVVYRLLSLQKIAPQRSVGPHLQGLAELREEESRQEPRSIGSDNGVPERLDHRGGRPIERLRHP
jgi:hypothetical protein